MNLQEEVSNMKGAPLTEEDKIELSQRATYAKKWLDEFAEREIYFCTAIGTAACNSFRN